MVNNILSSLSLVAHYKRTKTEVNLFEVIILVARDCLIPNSMKQTVLLLVEKYKKNKDQIG